MTQSYIDNTNFSTIQNETRLREVYFRWLKINEVNTVFPISITLFF